MEDRRSLEAKIAATHEQGSQAAKDAACDLQDALAAFVVSLDSSKQRAERADAYKRYKSALLSHRTKVGTWEACGAAVRDWQAELAQLAPDPDPEESFRRAVAVQEARLMEGGGHG